MSSVIGNEEDEDAQLIGLQMLKDGLDKTGPVLLDHCCRLGLVYKVAQLAGPVNATQEEEGDKEHPIASGEGSSSGGSAAADAETTSSSAGGGQIEAQEVSCNHAYHWKDWCIARGRDCLYIWSDAAALELSNGSNGWFRFILDGKLSTMYSSGSPEGGSENAGK